VAAATLDFERSGINRVMAGIRTYEELGPVRQGDQGGSQAPHEHAPRALQAGELKVEFEVGRMLGI